MTCSEYIKENGFPLPLTIMGLIVGYKRDWLNKKYKNDREWFDIKLEEAKEKWFSIASKKK